MTAALEPGSLAITLWDFTWLTRSGPGEPFDDLDRAFDEASDRGYDTIRIDAVPFLLFGSGLGDRPMTFEPLGGDYGQGTRWYDVKETTSVVPLERTLELFRAADRHGFRVIVSSWEYQQTPAFAADRAWFDALMAVDPEHRAERLADAHADLIDLLVAEGLDHVVAFVEIHNEVQGGRLTDGLSGDLVVALRPRLERAIARFKARHPDVLCTANYSRVPFESFRGIPSNIEVAIFHPYVNGVLEDAHHTFALRGTDPFPQERVRELFLRPGAPDLDDWGPGAGNEWKRSATIVGRETYLHDWCDPEAWDRWLYERYGHWAEVMDDRLTSWMHAAADFAEHRGIPLVFGEGWVGYTPAAGTFEEGPVGREFCRKAARIARDIGAAGSIVCSNAAPHHAMWADVELQRECNGILRETAG